jgi:hypothetical protein
MEMWDCLLAFTRICPGSWEARDIEEGLFGFWKGGGNGHLVGSYLCLLPLLSVLPKSVNHLINGTRLVRKRHLLKA